jgi:hypothetical protein
MKYKVELFALIYILETSLRFTDCLDELHEMSFLILEELKLFKAFLLLNLLSLAVAFLDCLDL